MGHQPEVCALSGRMMSGSALNPYLLDYGATFAFSGIRYPHAQQLSLRSACPCGRTYGLTVFRAYDKKEG
jgi:hypothetical protein